MKSGKKRSDNLAIELLTHLQKFYLNGKGVSLNSFFEPMNLPFTDIIPCITELHVLEYITVPQNYVYWGGKNNNIDQNFKTLSITASLKKEGNDYLNEYFERISNQKNIKRNETLDMFRIFIAILTIAATLFFGISNMIISGDIAKLKEQIKLNEHK